MSKKKKMSIAWLLALNLFLPIAAHAQTAKAACPKISDAFKHGFTDPLGDVCVPDLVNRLIVAALSVAGTIFFLLFIWGGLQWFTAGGEPGKVKKATTTLVNAVIGMAIIAASYAIVVTVIDFIAKGRG